MFTGYISFAESEYLHNLLPDKGFLVDSGSGIFNGDMGIITKINNLTNYIEVKFDDDRYVTYDSKQAEELELAYAVTIHKSQGRRKSVLPLPFTASLATDSLCG